MNLSWIKNTTLFVCSVAVTLIVVELGLRAFWAPAQISGWGWQDSPRRAVANFADDNTNELGVRGQSFDYGPDDFVVLLLGDSQVEAATSAPEKMPEKILQAKLSQKLNKNVKVFSLASSGWGQDQQLNALEKYYEDFRADLVLVFATPGNDFWENAFPDRSPTITTGHIKPTYYLQQEQLLGPYFANNFYYDLALFHLISLIVYSSDEKSLEAAIVENWLAKLPPAHNPSAANENQAYCAQFEQVPFAQFLQNIYEYKSKQLTVESAEDIKNSRSHFSPYSADKSPRDIYLVNLTRALFHKIEQVALEHQSLMYVFYPIREDFDWILGKNARCVKDNTNQYYKIDIDYLSTLKAVVPANKLIEFGLPGKAEIRFSKSDPHLSDVGNQRAMQSLAAKLREILKTELE